MDNLLFKDLNKLDLDVVTKRSIVKLRRDLGNFVMSALKDPDVIEIMLNPNKTLWTECRNKGMQHIGEMSHTQSENLIKMIASCVKEEIGPRNPLLECELPWDGSRFEGLLPPVVSNPSFCIRKHATSVYTLDDYVNSNILTEYQRSAIELAIKQRKNILVAGSTGSGKTTLVNAVIKCIEATHHQFRLMVIEDTNELQVTLKNNVVIRTNSNFSILQGLKATMRFRPDAIIVGEVRGSEALSLLKSWNTGHSGGCSTVHANNAAAALIRLEQLISEASTSPMQHLIAEAIDLIIFIEKETTHPAGRVVKEVVKLDSYKNGQYQLSNI